MRRCAGSSCSPRYYQINRTGDLMSRATNDLSAVRMVLGPGIMYTANTLATALGTIALMLAIDARLLLLSLVPLVAVSLAARHFGRRIHDGFEAAQAQLSELTALVQEAIGFNKECGDSIKLINAPFRTESLPKVETQPMWQQPWLLDLVRAAAVPTALVLVALLVVSGLIKPALKAATVAKPVGGQLDAVVADPLTPPQPHAPLALGSPQSEKTLADARALAKQNPAAVAHIVRDWVSKDAG